MIRFGVIGTNWITERLIDAGKETSEFSLAAVYSRTTERAREFASKHNAPYTFTDIETMAKSDLIDAVYIASPNSLHKEQALLFMKHKKHVLCEKPMASNSRELEEMVKVAKENKVLLMEALKSTLVPTFKSIQENLHKIGRVRRYVASYCQYSSRYDAYLQGKVLNAFDPTFSNGSLMDIGIYCLYPMVVLFGEPQSIKANAVLLKTGVDGQGSIILNYDDKEALVIYSKITNSNLPTEIQGENGSMIINNINTPTTVEIQFRDGTVEDLSHEQKTNIMYYELVEFMKLIKNGKLESESNSHQNSLVVAKIMEEARKQTGIVYPADEII